ncbi:Glutamyl-tRNA(Gln) amidotransferase subunit B, mitochondrial [Sphaceloma murrayae]|uniref:Glutamyl-tRNA(Gln) amidotransferase subunit B, mitochondrial n=1 Tax=Sphaceloma murrayae TaxID=2082308 RepID=A0A2K1QGQ9_9PEZI|nr:Glutamyl-tRNA(Gln) amidotransferase subunit B, mitochondrial [Sphaceloma murrayae]
MQHAQVLLPQRLSLDAIKSSSTRACSSSRWLRRLQTDTAPTPLRKQLKDEVKRRKKDSKTQGSSVKIQDQIDGWELTVGIEIHARLNTERKLFSSSYSTNTSEPNEHVALFDAALPGSQPQFQVSALIPAIRAALALNCKIQRKSAWDRKHYFYQDQPNGYQITQYYEPFALSGSLALPATPSLPDPPTIGIKQIQLEQDTAKTTNPPGTSRYLIDYSRVGAPLIEIISLPQIHSPSAAAAFVRTVRDALRHVDACEGNMEAGDLRADVNVSVRRSGTLGTGKGYAGVEGLGTRTEIKNLNSLKAVEEAVRAERDRQVGLLEKGDVIQGETRGWTVGATQTTRLRAKEGEVDYRYMPDPDLGPVWIDQRLVEDLRRGLPEVPEKTVERVMRDFGVSQKDAWTIFSLDDGDRLEFVAEATDQIIVDIGQAVMEEHGLDRVKLGKTVANWTLHEIGGLLATADMAWCDLRVSSQDLAAILRHLTLRCITGRSAKQLLQTVFDGNATGKSIEMLIEEGNMLLRPMSDVEYRSLAQDVMTESPDIVAAIREKGQRGKIMFFVGQMMRRADEGTVEADKARQVLEELLRV